MIHAVVFSILHPHPPGFRGRAVNAIIPSEVWGDGQLDLDDGTSDGLYAGCQVKHGEGMHQLRHLTTHSHMVHQVTCTG